MELEIGKGRARPGIFQILDSIFAGLIVLVVLLLFSPLNTPILARDEGVFVYIGRGVLEGKLPYRDLWDHKGPLIYYINALGLWIGHNSLWGIWLVEAVLLGGSLMVLYRLLCSTLSRQAALFGLITWCAGFLIVMGGNTVEEYAIPLTVLSISLAMRPIRHAALWLGILAGSAFMLRPNEIAGPVVALLFVIASRQRADGWSAALKAALLSGAGVLVVAGGVIGYFAWNHALSDLFTGMILFNLSYVSNGGNASSSLLAGAGFAAVPMLFGIGGLISGILAGSSVPSAAQRRLFYLAGGLLAMVVPLSLLSGRVYRHYYIPWLLPLSILSSYFCAWLSTATISTRLRKGLWALSWIVILLATLVGTRIRAVPLLAHGPPQAEQQAIESIRNLAPQDSELFIWGDETSYAVMAGRRLAGRYIYISPIVASRFGESVTSQVLSDITQSRPVIIDASGTNSGMLSLSGPPPKPYLTDLYAFIHRNYQIIGSIPGKNWIVWSVK